MPSTLEACTSELTTIGIMLTRELAAMTRTSRGEPTGITAGSRWRPLKKRRTTSSIARSSVWTLWTRRAGGDGGIW
ncbi:MAG: hypothetical protein PGN13_00660 [Patulibacter minatonensis]